MAEHKAAGAKRIRYAMDQGEWQHSYLTDDAVDAHREAWRATCPEHGTTVVYRSDLLPLVRIATESKPQVHFVHPYAQ